MNKTDTEAMQTWVTERMPDRQGKAFTWKSTCYFQRPRASKGKREEDMREGQRQKGF